MKRIYYFYLIIIPLWYGCTKDDTNTDASNTWSRVSCYASGHYWSDCSKDTSGQKMANSYGSLNITDSAQTMVMIFDHACGEGCTYCINRIVIRLYYYKGIGSYALNDPFTNNNEKNNYASCLKGMSDGGQMLCYTVGFRTDIVEVTKYDTLNRTISGNFSFDLFCGIADTVRITTGSFKNVPYVIQ